MRSLLALPLLALLVGGCAGAPPPPVVDMEGVDPARYSRDLASCDPNVFGVGNPITNCMERKGYRILRRN